jgi:hypothetical protein
MAYSASTLSSFDSMVQWGLSGGCVTMDARMQVATSGAVVVSTAGQVKNVQILAPKIARWFDGDDDFCNVRMTCSLRVCIPDKHSSFA